MKRVTGGMPTLVLRLMILVGPACGGLLAADAQAPSVGEHSTDAPSVPIERWIDDLGSKSFVQRDFAGRQLLRQGTAAIEALVSVAGGEDAVAAQAATALLSQVARDDLGEFGGIAHRGLSQLAGEDQTVPPARTEAIRQAVQVADRRIAGLIAAQGGQIERDERLTIVGLVAHDEGFTDAQAPLLARLTQLKRLDLRETAVGDAAVAVIRNLPELQELNLSDTAVTREGLQRLAPLRSLTRLSIYRLPIAQEELQMLRALLPECDIRH